jgi:hypothetical protein
MNELGNCVLWRADATIVEIPSIVKMWRLRIVAEDSSQGACLTVEAEQENPAAQFGDGGEEAEIA